MERITAVAFDLFNTLITMETVALEKALDRLLGSLGQSGFTFESTEFKRVYLGQTMGFVRKARRHGRETHNRFWIAATLRSLGHRVRPDDPRIAAAVDAYFSAFFEHCCPIPGTSEMLGILKDRYRLGLLSNFTHGPAARRIIDQVGLTSLFEVVLISGELGYRKPHPTVYRRLMKDLDVKGHQILYVGDDPEPDIFGARKAGLRPVWFTYVQDHGIPFAPGIMSSEKEVPGSDVPRASTWEDLLALLAQSQGNSGIGGE
jgi:putative hydrolase of the HAD superfamily